MKVWTSLVTLALTLSSAFADTNEDKSADIKEEKFRVIAAPYAGQTKGVPASIYRLNSEDVRMTLQADGFTDSFRELPGVYVQKTSAGRGAPILRGFSSSRNLLIADGVRVNNPILREGPNEYWNLLDPYTYTNVELVLGPGSVIYGSDAIGGVLLVSSEALGRGQAGEGMQWLGGDAYLRYGSAQDSFSENIKMRLGVDDDLAFSLSFTKQTFGDLHMGNATLERSAYSEWGTNFRMEYDVDDNSTLIFGYDHFDQDDTNRVHKTVAGESFRGTSNGSDAYRFKDLDRRAAFTRYIYRDGEGVIKSADIGLSLQYMKENYKRLETSGSIRQHKVWTDATYALNMRFVSDSPIGELTYGLDYYHDKINSRGYDRKKSTAANSIQGVVADDTIYQQLGVYLQDKIQLSERFHVIAGGRFSTVKLNANQVTFNGQPGDLSNNWDAFTYSLHGVYDFSDDNSINGFAGISQGFRAPNLSDVSRDDEFGSRGQESPTANLNPEHYTTYEMGLNVQKADYRMQFSVFHTQIRDLIARQSGAKTNLRYGYVNGAELAMSYSFNTDWGIFGNISWVETHINNHINQNINNGIDDDQMSKVPPINGMFGIRWTPNDKFWAETYAMFADRQNDLSQGDHNDGQRIPANGTPGYVTYNLRMGYKLTEQADISLAIENFTDVDYRIHGSGQNNAGLNGILTLHYKF